MLGSVVLRGVLNEGMDVSADHKLDASFDEVSVAYSRVSIVMSIILGSCVGSR